MMFILPGILAGAMGLITILALANKPEDLGLEPVDATPLEGEQGEGTMERTIQFDGSPNVDGVIHGSTGYDELGEGQVEQRSLGFLEAWAIPNVALYALAYALLKSINYVMFFWLPSYLNQFMDFSDKQSDNVSMLYDVGQIFGGFVCGGIADWMGHNAPPVYMMAFLAIIPVFLLRLPDSHLTVISLLTFASGFLVGGPCNLISSAISADLGKNKSLEGNEEAVSTVTGIIDGTASFGTALSMAVVALLQKAGWDTVFIFLTALLLASLVLLFGLFRREMREWIRELDGYFKI